VLIVNLIGGLGNQMFQYAAGRALALELGTPLRLDISGFARYTLHQGFELPRIFTCPILVAGEDDVRGILGWQYPPRLRRIISRPVMAAFRRKNFIIESSFRYCSGIKNVPDDSYLVGYWQSERYFADAVAQIREDFTFRIPLEMQNANLARQIGQSNAVSLHVRRGDYAADPMTTATHGLCSLDYYRMAISHIAERVQQPRFFVFSDDIAWTRNNLTIDFPHQYIDHNHGADSYNDMHLMSLCRHHIIANSSFSWWGAWLNRGGDKIVVAPKRWFANKTDTQDLIPKNWVRL